MAELDSVVHDAFLSDYFNRSGNVYNNPGAAPQSGLTATGGVISDYTVSGTVYRSHIFTSSGTFDVTEIGTFGSNVDFLVVAGGGGGGNANSSGHDSYRIVTGKQYNH